MPKGIIGGIMVLVALGLILRFGKSSQALMNSGFYGINSMIGSLSLSQFPGNTPN